MRSSAVRRVRSLLLISIAGAGAAAAQQGGATDSAAMARQILAAMNETPRALRSVHYEVLYVCREEFATQRKTILEATRRNVLGFLRRMKLDVEPRHERLLVILLDTQQQMQEFARRSGTAIGPTVAGFYSHEKNWAIFYNQRKGDDVLQWEQWTEEMARRLIEIPGGPQTRVNVTTPTGPVTLTKQQVADQIVAHRKQVLASVNEFNTTVTQHEGAHQVAFNVGVQRRGAAYPFWVSEGLACLFETPPQSGRSARGAARVNSERLGAYRAARRAGRALGLRRLIALGQGDAIDAEAAYAESWSLFTFLFQRHSKELSAYLRSLAQRGENQRPDETSAFRKAFGGDLDALEQELEKFVERLD